jgi:hypothetical protein
MECKKKACWRSQTWPILRCYLVVLDGVMTSVLDIELNARAFNSGGGRRIFKDDKNSHHSYLRNEVMPSAQCRKILRHVKYPLEV